MASWPPQVGDEYALALASCADFHGSGWPADQNMLFKQWQQSPEAQLHPQTACQNGSEYSDAGCNKRLELGVPFQKYMSDYFHTGQQSSFGTSKPTWNNNILTPLPSPPIENGSNLFFCHSPPIPTDSERRDFPSQNVLATVGSSPNASFSHTPRWTGSFETQSEISESPSQYYEPKTCSGSPQSFSATQSPPQPPSTLPSASKKTTKLDSVTAARRHKETHKMIEKKYRNRLNGYFEDLLSVLTKTEMELYDDGEEKEKDERRISKGKVLVLAVEHIRALEMQKAALEMERDRLAEEIERLRGGWTTRRVVF